jgi:hypothetical protein
MNDTEDAEDAEDTEDAEMGKVAEIAWGLGMSMMERGLRGLPAL